MEKFFLKLVDKILFIPIFLTLSAGPLLYYLKNFQSPSSFLLDFSMITFTAGMFSLIVKDHREKFSNFEEVGSMYLLSGSLALTLLFVTPYMKGSDTSLGYLPQLLQPIVDGVGTGLIGVVFILSSVGFSISFGKATHDIIKPVWKDIIYKKDIKR